MIPSRARTAPAAAGALVYALVDLPTNPSVVAADHLLGSITSLAEAGRAVVLPAPEDAGPGVSDVGSPAPRC